MYFPLLSIIILLDFSGEKDVRFKSETSSIFFFISLLCGLCAILLAGLSTFLAPWQEMAVEEDRGREMLIAARILSSEGNFLIKDDQGNYVPAIFDLTNNTLEANADVQIASSDEVLAIVQNRLTPLLVDDQGNSFTFEEKEIDLTEYLKENQKSGFASLPLKLIYQINSNSPSDQEAVAYIIPINGFGLWGPIYGYLAIQKDGETVIGTTWYDQGETAGLGAEISSNEWQEQFYNKNIFQPTQEGTVDIETAPIGIQVVKGQVSQVYGTGPRADNAVDGISGATLTGNGVTNAYRTSLTPYRPFFIKLNEGN